MSISFPYLSGLKTTVLDLLFPYRCVGCGVEGQTLCPGCLSNQRRPSQPLCQSCGEEIRAAGYCKNCENQPQAFDSVRSSFVYQDAIREAIIQFKYKGITNLAPVLGREMALTLAQWGVKSDLLIPVPLHHKRFKERGYNQAALLAKAVARESGIGLDDTSLVKHIATPQQAKTKSREDRRRQVEHAFICADPSKVINTHIVLVDDVCTTGATLNACAKVLKDAGARTVWGLTVARDLSEILSNS